ncbi:hypothetical protein BASA62_006210 [Batrachochytrium salamandrivorans]|nr:hypothetical protein BASA62_006210 [Batrachochytrium salamandrivorans]
MGGMQRDLGSPAFCAFRGASISDPVLVGVTASTSSTYYCIGSDIHHLHCCYHHYYHCCLQDSVEYIEINTKQPVVYSQGNSSSLLHASNSNNAEPTTHVNTGIIVGAVIGWDCTAPVGRTGHSGSTRDGRVVAVLVAVGSSKIQLDTQSRGNGPAPPGSRKGCRHSCSCSSRCISYRSCKWLCILECRQVSGQCGCVQQTVGWTESAGLQSPVVAGVAGVAGVAATVRESHHCERQLLPPARPSSRTGSVASNSTQKQQSSKLL